MIELYQRDFPYDIILAAYGYSFFRKGVKNYLIRHGVCYDKFTVTENDSFIGYVSEKVVEKYILDKYRAKGVAVETWAAKYDLFKVASIVNKDSNALEDINYVKEYFYDKYDLKIIYQQKELFVDIKSAETEKEPTGKWNFLYPVIQSERLGKDYVILAYYVKNSSKLIDLKKIVLCGYMEEKDIVKCEIQPKGTKTIYKTVSQIDNYITWIKDYKQIDELIANLIGSRL